jgi:hypothetical protein
VEVSIGSGTNLRSGGEIDILWSIDTRVERCRAFHESDVTPEGYMRGSGNTVS